MKKTTIVTECGHQYNTGYKAERLSGCTTDCRICGELLIFPEETTVGTCVRARVFHFWMNEQWNDWPHDGHGTSSIGIEV